MNKSVRYYVEHIAIGTCENKSFAYETHTTVFGKGEVMFDIKRLAYHKDDGWSQKRFAEQYIAKAKEYDLWSDNRFGHTWDNYYTILAIEFD